MPSIGHRPLKFKNRYMILRELRNKNQRRETLAKIFEATIGRMLPAEKPQVTTGYTETKINYCIPKQEQLRFNQLLYELKRDGLVVGENERSTMLKITDRGRIWLKKFKDGPPLELPRYTEPAEKDTRVTIISYDIPNHSTPLRNWLRKSLQALGLKAIQRSVFIGKIKLPADLLRSIVELKLEKYVEIFEITKTGTLRQRLQ